MAKKDSSSSATTSTSAPPNRAPPAPTLYNAPSSQAAAPTTAPTASVSRTHLYNHPGVELTSGSSIGAYKILAPLGSGGMGEVYRATDTRLSRDVALKVLPPEMAQDADRLARFQREANILAHLDHPNIVTIYSVENCEGVHFLTMQLVQGTPLDRLISGPGLSLHQVIRLAEMTADALDAAHQKGIIHRDLKPANIMVTDSGSVKVLDFGLAKNVRDFDDAIIIGSGHTQIGAVMGTPAYMSPEQATGRPLDHRTDIF